MRRRTCRCVLIALLCGAAGCADAARARVTRWLFDVPDGDNVANESGDYRDVIAPTIVHAPVRDRQCRSCHDASRMMHVRDDFLTQCRSCHRRYFSDEVGHLPVIGEECLTCHQVHASRWAGLLKMSVYDTCVECHLEPIDLSPEAHDRPDVNGCTQCHDPHFGSGMLLRPGLPTVHVLSEPAGR